MSLEEGLRANAIGCLELALDRLHKDYVETADVDYVVSVIEGQARLLRHVPRPGGAATPAGEFLAQKMREATLHRAETLLVVDDKSICAYSVVLVVTNREHLDPEWKP